MNILDKSYRRVQCEGQTFSSLSNMQEICPELKGKSWKFVGQNVWLLDPHTGEVKTEYYWSMEWLEDVVKAWEGLAWSEAKESLFPVIVDQSDPERHTFISYDMALEMMKAGDPVLMKEVEDDPCSNASMQDVWDAFHSYQETKRLLDERKAMEEAMYDRLMDEACDSVWPEMQDQ